MRERNWKELLARVVILLLGLTIAHLGVTLFLLADLGSDPFNVLVQGIFRSLEGSLGWPILTHGRVHICICLLIIAFLLLSSRGYVKIGTLLCMICGGPIIDGFTALLQPLFSGEVLFGVKILVNALGCVILAYGMTIVIQSEAGTGPNDLVAIVLADKLKKKFSLVRVLVDLCFALLGYLLGGTLGLGTVICAFVVGPVAGIFLPKNKILVKKALNRVLG